MTPGGGRVAFELERFETTEENRLEVVGRWFGVRGLRFVRPALTLQTEEGERSLLAVLEHKPWAAEEGESWVAAFPWKGDSPDPDDAVLTVAPSVVIALARGKGMGGASPKPTLRDRLANERERVRRLEAEVAWLREEREALIEERDSAKADANREQEGLKADADRARAELAEARTELKAARRERDKAVAEHEEMAQRVDELRRERDALFGQREAALLSSQTMTQQHDGLVAERDRLAADRARAVRELQAARLELQRVAGERDAMLAERDDALSAAKAALAERDAALGRGTGFPAVSASDLARAPSAPRHRRFHFDASDREQWLARVIALSALSVILLVIAALLRFA